MVLQAQEYSSSGRFDYPVDGAVELVKQSRSIGALPILFHEWQRRGIPETQRIYVATTMTGVAPDTLPALDGFNVAADVQARLRAVAAETVLACSPRTGCPGDRVGI